VLLNYLLAIELCYILGNLRRECNVRKKRSWAILEDFFCLACCRVFLICWGPDSAVVAVLIVILTIYVANFYLQPISVKLQTVYYLLISFAMVCPTDSLTLGLLSN